MSEQAGAAAADRGDAPAQPLRGDSAGRRLWRQRASEPSGAVRRAAWSGLALTVGQLALMATNLVLSLGLGYAGGLAVVGATAPAVLVFQLTCGVLQRTFAEATLLASAHTGRTGDRQAARWSVAGALLGGTAGGLVAVLASVAVPHAPVRYAVVYAAGIPFAIALDIGRSADVAQGKARAAFADAAAWLTVHIGLTTTFAAVHSPMGICLSWTLVNVVFCAVAALRGYRSPALRGLTGWLRSRRGLMGSASLDALLVGLTPLLALQATALVAPAATVGAIRVLQQLFAPLAFLSIVLRRVLIYLRRAEVRSTVGEDFRDGVLAMLLTVAGGVLLGAAVVLGRRYVAALAFIPAGTAMVAAGWSGP